jgi:predicted patatin/cPLA2 family phospholipase
MAGGRPRTTTLPPDDMIAFGEEMIKFVSDPKNKALSLSEFYTGVKGYTYKEWKIMYVAPEFAPYYEKALRIVGKKYLDGTVNASIAQRYLRRYDAELREQEDADMRIKADIDKDSKKEEASNALEGMARVLDQITKTREDLAQRKTPD